MCKGPGNQGALELETARAVSYDDVLMLMLMLMLMLDYRTGSLEGTVQMMPNLP